MRRAVLMTSVLSLSGCGLEAVFANLGHGQYDRPASKISGTVPAGTKLPVLATDPKELTVIDGDGSVIEPFLATIDESRNTYELRLPSAKYSMLRVRVDLVNMELRTIVPAIGEESAVSGVNLDVRSTTETIIAEARLSADGDNFKQVTPDAYEGTRKLVQAAFDTAGPSQQLLGMAERIVTAFDPTLSVSSPYFFNMPVFGAMWNVKSSALDAGWLAQMPFDFVGDGRARRYSDDFDAKLAETAKLFRPKGCPDPGRIRLVLTCDFNAGGKNGSCGDTDRFKWATDKPGKAMYFVGWIYTNDPPGASQIQDPATNTLVGASTPNNIAMYDDGTNGDEKAGDGIWSIYFDVPRSIPGHVLRIGYKYTWGTRGAGWSGSEEWPGNSRMLEVVDDNGDDFVYRRDVFGDEATNKDKSNLNVNGTGSLSWTTDLHGCGTPESHENRYDNEACTCGSVQTPKWLGALTVTCTQ